jgi:hypothetical protein
MRITAGFAHARWRKCQVSGAFGTFANYEPEDARTLYLSSKRDPPTRVDSIKSAISASSKSTTRAIVLCREIKPSK